MTNIPIPARSGDFRDLDILVVADQIRFREDLRGILGKLGCKHVRLVDRGLQALTEVCHQHPDFILLDVIMPGMDGLTASTIIRDYEADVGYRAFVAGLSNGKVDWQDYCIEAGMDVCLRKPVCHRNLEQLLRNLTIDSASSDVHQSENLPHRTT